MNHEDILNYWSTREEGRNAPEGYLKGEKKTALIVGIIKSLNLAPPVSVLEIGCNVGRNLNGLYAAGFRDLYGIEINKKAVRLMRSTYKDMYKNSTIYCGPVEDVLNLAPPVSVIFSMAVFCHLHPRFADNVFNQVAEKTNCIITLEDEKKSTWRHFPRNYERVFSIRGFRAVSVRRIKKSFDGINRNYFLRVLVKAD